MSKDNESVAGDLTNTPASITLYFGTKQSRIVKGSVVIDGNEGGVNGSVKWYWSFTGLIWYPEATQAIAALATYAKYEKTFDALLAKVDITITSVNFDIPYEVAVFYENSPNG